MASKYDLGIELTSTNSPESTSEKSSKVGTNTVLVDDTLLQRLDARPTLGIYLKQLWQRRTFIWYDARSKAFKAGKNTYLGRLWVVLEPLLQVSVYGLVFGIILQVSRGFDNFVGFLVIGVIFFGFVSKSLSAAAGLVRQSRNLITSFRFPRAAVALSTSVRLFLDSLIPAVLAVFLALLFQLDKQPTWTIALVIPLFLLMHLFNLGLLFWIGRLTAFFPDFKSLINLVNRALFFTSGVFFSIDRFDTHPVIQSFVEINPIYQFLMAIRTCVLTGTPPELTVWVYLATVSVLLAVTGFIYFWQAEERYSRAK